MGNLTDIMGEVIHPGDTVVYPQGSGRSIQMVIARFIDYNGKTAKLQRIEGSRWQSTYSSTRYRHRNTGKDLKIYQAGYPHHDRQPRQFYRNRITGEEITYEEFFSLVGDQVQKHYDWVRDYDPGALKDYVEEYTPESPPVNITNTANIIKVFPGKVDQVA